MRDSASPALSTTGALARAGAIIPRDGHALLTRGLDDPFWALPGGRIDPGEISDETLLHELLEELGVAAVIRRLIWVIENRFAHAGRRYCEIGFYYLADLPREACPRREGEFMAREAHIAFRWHPLAAAPALDIRPPFPRTRLGHLPAAVEYLRLGRLGSAP